MENNGQTKTGKLLTIVQNISLGVLALAIVGTFVDFIFYEEQYREKIRPFISVALGLFGLSVVLTLVLRKRL